MTQKFDQYPKTDMYQIVDCVPVDHPYTLTAGHIEHAANRDSGVLSIKTIIEYEAIKGKPCCGKPGCTLWYGQHEQAISVEVAFDGPLQEAPGLQNYLISCREQMLKDGTDGFVFEQKAGEDG